MAEKKKNSGGSAGRSSKSGKPDHQKNDPKQKRSIGDWLFVTKDGSRVYGQAPNWPIYAAFGSYIVAILLGSREAGDLPRILNVAGDGFLIYWAALEIFQGVNNWRRILGTVIFIIAGLSLVGEIFGVG